MTLPNQLRPIITMAALLLIAACGGGGGGGGGGGTIAPPPPPPPPPPVRTPQPLYFAATDPNTMQRHVFSESDEGGALQQLTPNFASSASRVRGFSLSPDGQTLAYTANADDASVVDLYVIPAAGGTPTKVSSGLPANTGVSQLAWSPDSASIAYTANPAGRAPRGFTIFEVFLADRDGANNRKINGSIGNPPSVTVDNIKWSPDGRFLAQMVSILDPFLGRIGLNVYDTTVGAPNSTRITAPVDTGNFETIDFTYQWSPDSTRIAYLSEHDTGRPELFVANAAGAFGVTKVSGALVANGRVSSLSLSWSSDGERVLYYAGQESSVFFNLYVGNADGSGDIRLDDPIAGTTESTAPGGWSPDGTRVLYAAAEDLPDARGLYIVNPDGSGKIRVNPPLVAGQALGEFRWSPDGSSVSYRADLETDNIFELYVTGADGTGNVKVSGPLVMGGQVNAHHWSPDSRHIAYLATQNDTAVRELFVSSADGTTNNQVNAALAADADIRFLGVTWANDSTRIAFMDETDDFISREVLDLYLGTIDGAAPIRLNDTNDFDGTFIY